MNNYYNEIENIIKRNEVNKLARKIEENNDTLTNYWNIGKLLVEAQGGESRSKYGNELIKKWSIDFTKKYGKGYDRTNLIRFRQFYITFPISGAVRHLSWTHIRTLLPIKDENERNYYINLCTSKMLSDRELKKVIKENTYERLIDKPEHIEIINHTPKYNIMTEMHNPIHIELNKNEKINDEHDLEVALLARLKNFFSQLGEGFTLVGNQYKIIYKEKPIFIDILLFNYEINSFVVVELKARELQHKDKGQIELYMGIVDETMRKPLHNKTIGILITKKQDKFIAEFIGSDCIIPLTYEVI